MARLRFDNNICVGWFSVDLGGEGAIILTMDEDIKEGYFAINLLLAGKFYPVVDFVETLIECLGWVHLVSLAA